MECNKPESGSNELQTDGLQLVRDINKYLRKALKKIEAIQKASDKLQEEPSTVTQNTATCSKEKEESVSVSVTRAKKVKNSSAKCSKESDNVSVSKTTTSDSSNTRMYSKSIEDRDYVEHEVDENHDHNDSSQTHDTIEIESEEEHGQPPQTYDIQPITKTRPCIKFKLEKPTEFIPIPVFYKAYISNIPLLVNVANIKAWLELKGVSNYEDIVLYSKPTFKTSVVSYYDKATRDRLLLLDGQMYDNWPLKIRLFIDQFAPDNDKEAYQLTTSKQKF